MARFIDRRIPVLLFSAVSILGLLTFNQLSPAFAVVGTPISSTTATSPNGYGYQGKIYQDGGLVFTIGTSDGTALTCQTSSDGGATWSTLYGMRSQGQTTQGSYFATYVTQTTFTTTVPTVSEIGTPSGGATKSFTYSSGTLTSNGCPQAVSLGTLSTNSGTTGTSDAMTLNDVVSGDKLLVVATSLTAASTPATATAADGGDSFSSQSSTSLSNTCLAGASCYVNILTATAGSSSSSLSVTVTYSQSTFHQSVAYDLHGYTLTGIQQNVGSSTSCVSPCSASVGGFTPSSGSIVVSAIAIDNSAGTQTAGTGFITIPSANTGDSSYLQGSSGAQTAPWTVPGGSGNPIAYVEAAVGLACANSPCSSQEAKVSTTNNVVDGGGPSVVQDQNGVTYASIETNDGTLNHIEVYKCAAGCTTSSNWSKINDISAAGVTENGIIGVYNAGIYLIWRNQITCGLSTCHQLSIETSTNAGASWSGAFSSGAVDIVTMHSGGVIASGHMVMVAAPCASADGGGCATTTINWVSFDISVSKWAESQYSFDTGASASISWDPAFHQFFSFFTSAEQQVIIYVTNNTDTTMNPNMYAIATPSFKSASAAAVSAGNQPVDPPAVLWRSGAGSPYVIKDAVLASFPPKPNEVPTESISLFGTEQAPNAALHEIVGLAGTLSAGLPANREIMNVFVCIEGGGTNGTAIGGACVASGQPVSITVVTSPSTLINALTIDGVTYGSGLHVFNWIVGSNHTLLAQPTSLGAGLIMYSFQSWSDGGAATHTFTVPSLPTTVTAAYGTGGSGGGGSGGPPTGGACTTTNLETALNSGCAFGVVFYFWFGIFGPWALAFLDFLPALAVYLRTESPAAAVGVYVLIDVVIVTGLIAANFPAALSTVGPGLLGAVIAGGVFQLVRSNKGG